MDYKIGQLRSSQITEFGVDIPTLDYSLTTKSILFLGEYRNETCLLYNQNFNKSKSFFVKVKINTKDTIQNLAIKSYSSSSNIYYQNIKKITVPATTVETTHIYVEFVFNPMATIFNEIVFLNSGLTYTGAADIEIIDICEIVNLISHIDNVELLLKIGIQSKSGTLLCINGNEIRIPSSNVYETLYDIPISFFGVIKAKENDVRNIDYFLLDYTY